MKSFQNTEGKKFVIKLTLNLVHYVSESNVQSVTQYIGTLHANSSFIGVYIQFHNTVIAARSQICVIHTIVPLMATRSPTGQSFGSEVAVGI